MPIFRRVISAAIPVLAGCLFAAAQSEVREYRIGLEGRPWSVLLRLKDFEVNQSFVRPDGRRYFYASNQKTGVNLSVTLEKTGKPATRDGCRTHVQRLVQSNGEMAKDPEFSETDRFVIAAYTIAEVQGLKINQRFFRACTSRDDVYIDFNLSKATFQKGEEQLFLAALDASSLDERPEPPRGTTSFDYWAEGTRLFNEKRDYRAAIAPYEKALELEKQQRELKRDYWYVLIDNLGMAHGITGNLARAKEIFEYGIRQDPKYPLFYYNLACAYAEMNDKKNAMEQLAKAYDFKENVIPGEKIPDPRNDDSFRRFMKDKDFRDLVERLVRSAK